MGKKYLCRCDCGKEIVFVWDTIRKNRGCSKCKKNRLAYKTFLNRVLHIYEKSAEKRKLEFKLKKIYFNGMIKSSCHYCGSKPSNQMDNHFYNGIDSLKGYIVGNCVPCCHVCNRAKSNKSVGEFFEWATNLYRHSIVSSKE